MNCTEPSYEWQAIPAEEAQTWIKVNAKLSPQHALLIKQGIRGQWFIKIKT